jgi:hypothetical protein
MSSTDLTSSLLDISQSLTTNILAEANFATGNSNSNSTTASRELLNSKRKSRDDNEDITTQEEYIPLIRAPRKRLRAIAPTSTSTSTTSSSQHKDKKDKDSLLSSITQGGTIFSINDTSFHNANKNAKVISKAQRKKNAKGSNYADKVKTRIAKTLTTTKQKSNKNKRKGK